MSSVVKSLIFFPLALAVAGNASNAETAQKPHSIQKFLQDTQSLPTIRSGAHGKKSPHAGLPPEKHIQIALQHKSEGRMGEAFRTLDEAISRNPLSAELFAVRGSFFLEKQSISQALTDFESALKLAPDSAAILTNRAQAYRHFGRINEALRDLNKAIELNPELLAAHFNRGSIHFSSQEYELALKDFDACVAINPHEAGPYFNRASSRDALGDREGAIADIKRFIEIAGQGNWKQTAEKLLEQWESSLPDEQPGKNNT